VVSFGALFPEPDAVDFPSVAPGSSHPWRATREFTALAELMLAVDWGRLDLLLVDLPPGADRTEQFADFLGRDAAFVMVTLPSLLAQGVVTRSVTMLERSPTRLLGYIENMSGYYCPECDSVKPLFPRSTPATLALPCLGRVPFDPRLAAMCDEGETAPERPATACDRATEQIAGRLLAILEEVE
jgi:ATP-binding protein involved in chromosome partitioning